MAKIRPDNPNDTRSPDWHTKVWDFIEQHPGVAERYEGTASEPGGVLNSAQLSDYDQAVIREAEKRANQ